MGLPLPLLNLRRRRLAGGKFSPAALFANSEPGVWYDPSDLTTMFQDRAGTKLVTAPGQTVGRVLDKSQGLVLGPELVTNGDFSNGSTGWTLGSGWSVSGGVATYSGTDNANLAITNIVEAGKFYEVRFDVVSGSGVTIAPYLVTQSVLTTASFVNVGVGSYRAVLLAPSSGGLVLRRQGGTNFSIDNVSVRELPGNHMVAVSDAARGSYNVDEAGRGFILFDGADDGYSTSTITPGTDKAQVFAGVRKLSDAARGTVAELSTSIASSNGALHLTAPNAASDTFAFESKGTTLTDAVATPFAAPITSVLTGLGDIAGDSAILRVNGLQADADTGDHGTGNYLAAPLYIGRRGAASQPFNGRLYSLIVRFGPNLTADQIAATESWVNSKTGAY